MAILRGAGAPSSARSLRLQWDAIRYSFLLIFQNACMKIIVEPSAL
jgi:hypothetical protein